MAKAEGTQFKSGYNNRVKTTSLLSLPYRRLHNVCNHNALGALKKNNLYLYFYLGPFATNDKTKRNIYLELL